jgi:signal recognition particle GTPase
MKKMGSMSKLLGMLPGMPGAQGAAMKKQIESLDDSETDRAAAIIQSMTPEERSNPKIMNGSRRLRIAKGSGHEVSTVNKLLDRFAAAQKAMKQVYHLVWGEQLLLRPPEWGAENSGRQRNLAPETLRSGLRRSAVRSAPFWRFGPLLAR